MSFSGLVAVAPGRRLFVRDEGSGAPVLFLHGFTGCGETMAAPAAALPEGRRALRVDLLGHGRSDAPPEPADYGMEATVRDLVALLAARGISRCDVVGYSMGARIALGMAVLAPEVVGSVVGVGARAGLADASARRARVEADETLADRIVSRGIAWFVDHWMALPIFASQRRLGAAALGEMRRQRMRNRPEGLAASLRGIGAGAQPPLFDALARVEIPVLLVTGSEDERFTRTARELCAILPNARCEVLPDAGHAAHLENPEAFARVVGAFLSGPGVGSGSGDLPAAPRPGSVGAWWRAARPATLPASLVPVAVGSAVAFAEGALSWRGVATCWVVATALQLATNFVNDYADFERGTDRADRLGPPRAAQQEWLTPRALRFGAAVALSVATLAGIQGILLGGWPIAVGGALALVCAWAYTGGPVPLGYHGFGDVLVFVFFGLFAVVGTHWVQAGTASAAAWATAVPIGCLATALIAVNNLRDRPTDVASGKRTLAVRFGPAGARRYTAGCVVAAYLGLPAVAGTGAGPWAALPLATLPLAVPVLRSILSDAGPRLNRTLAATGRLEVAFGSLLGLAWVGSAWAA